MKALGGLNFRDLGGIEAGGGTIRHGILYRSEGPASFGEDHRAELLALGFRTVCDLRSPIERERHPNDWATGLRLLHLDIIADIRAQVGGLAGDGAQPAHERARATMLRNYRSKTHALVPHLAGIVDLIVAGETPMLVHCTAGKDRTGVLVALLLLLVGVSRTDVETDYLLSRAFLERPGAIDDLTRRIEEMTGNHPDGPTMRALAGVDPAYLQESFDTIERDWGSLDAYFAAAGIDATRRQALFATLVA